MGGREPRDDNDALGLLLLIGGSDLELFIDNPLRLLVGLCKGPLLGGTVNNSAGCFKFSSVDESSSLPLSNCSSSLLRALFLDVSDARTDGSRRGSVSSCVILSGS